MTIEKSRQALKKALQEAAGIDLSGIDPHLRYTSWSLAPDALRFLAALCERLLPRHILEFGSGMSTQVMDWACTQANLDCLITSLDHDPDYAYSTESTTTKARYKSKINVIIAPLVARKCAGKYVPIYHLGTHNASHPVDLVLLDGPPLSLGGRLGTLYQAMNFARKGTVILLDDSDRKEEKENLDYWQATLGDAIEVQVLPGFERGLTAIIVHNPVGFDNVDQHRLRITASELSSVIPEESKIILVDDENWTGTKIAAGLKTVPFLEHNGSYYGPPADDETAINELERLRNSGAEYIVFGWPTFWWLRHYAGFYRHLSENYHHVMDNGRLVVWRLQ